MGGQDGQPPERTRSSDVDTGGGLACHPELPVIPANAIKPTTTRTLILPRQAYLAIAILLVIEELDCAMLLIEAIGDVEGHIGPGAMARSQADSRGVDLVDGLFFVAVDAL